MADVVIRGMDMPEDGCFRCWMDNYCFKRGYGKFGNNGACPLFPIPEGHGKLIDADELMNRARGCLDELTLLSLEFLINGSNTIIPAEGDETDADS